MSDKETFDIEEFKARIKRTREALTEFVDYIETWEDTQRKRRNAEPTPTQH